MDRNPPPCDSPRHVRNWLRLLLCLLGCSLSPRLARQTYAAASVAATSSASTSTFVLLDVGSGVTSATNARLADLAVPPCSTFKIPNTLIGLSTDVIPDETFSLPWDGVVRGLPEWNQDHDLTSAMRYSVVWFYQEVARRIGAERMQSYVKRFAYGNESTCCAVDNFWLSGKLRITPRQQVDFLRRMVTGKLPVEREHVQLVRRLINIESNPSYRLYGKTGTCSADGRGVAWLVGLAERGGRQWIYALLHVYRESATPPTREQRIAEVKQLLVNERALPGR